MLSMPDSFGRALTESYHDTGLFSLAGKTAMITGASSGIGRHLARVMADAGAGLIVTARRRDRLDELVEELNSTGHRVTAASMDVTSASSVREAFDSAEQHLGTVDVLINNAGVAEPKYFLDVDEADWDRTMDTNLKGAWRVASECSRRLVMAKIPGSIVNMASILSFATQSMQSVYAVSKAGLAHLTHTMASELTRHRIRVNAIAPGYILTEMNEAFFASEKGQAYIQSLPMRRLGRADELAGAVLLLASDAGSFINGVVLPVDGGHLVAGR